VETGGREVRVFPEINIDVARRICKDRGDRELQGKYSELIDKYAEAAKSKWSIVEFAAQVVDSPKVLNFFLGEYGLIDNACSVKNTVVISNKEERTRITDGAIVKDCTMQWGAQISTGALTEGSIFTEHSGADRHGKVFDSLIGANTNIAEGEVTSSLVGSFVGFHHQALLISAFWPGGKGNIAYGSNIGSNHTGKEPDQELWPGEGMFFGLDCAIKYPADFTNSPYSIISSGTITLPQKVSFPFSLINSPSINFDDISPAFNEIFPAWILSDNFFMIKRNEEKYRQRNRAKRIHLKFSIFRPSIVDKMVDAEGRLKVASMKDVYTESDIEGLGKNYLLESNRIKAINTYDYYIRYYCLNLMFRYLLTHKTSEADLDEILHQSTDDEEWEHARNLFLSRLEFSSLNEAGITLIEIKNAIAKQIFESKQRDDLRGEKITKGYNEAHVLAEDNEFVKKTMDQTQTYEQKIRKFLKSPKVGA
ncbi:MAG: DUF4954 family protein, partial [Spirochaetales bacterium]|nr:DUF4954 family protein [Spirochaetales bacterium]